MGKEKETIDELLEALVQEEEQSYEVPSNWVWIKIKGVADIKGGKRLPKGHKLLQEVTPYPYLRVMDFKNGTIDESNGLSYLSKETANAISKYTISEDDVYISIAGSIGKTGIIPKHLNGANLTENAAKITCLRGIDKKFLQRMLSSQEVQFQIKESTVSTSQPKLALFRIADLKIPLPPFNEQKRIAEKVERLLSKIEEAKRLIDEAKESFEFRRAAILDKAFHGELTREWRKDNTSAESAIKRLEMIKKERFQIAETKREIVEITEMFDELNTEECINNIDWLYLKANMFCYNINCGGTPSKDISDEGEIPFLKVYNIVNNKVAFSYKPQYIPKEVHKSKLKKSILKPNDVIMNIVGPPLKKIAIIPEEYSEMNMNQAIVRFRPMKCVLPKYLYFCLQYDETLREVINETRGVVGQSNISVSQSRNLDMPIPSLEEQAEIVRKLEDLIEKEETVLYGIISTEKKLEILKQSILSKAFKGELGTNYPSEKNAIELIKEVLEEKGK